MKVLFICRANVGRSQMAEGIFNDSTNEHQAISAGLKPPVEWEGQKLVKTKYVVPCMLEIGIDLREKTSKKLTEDMFNESDKVIVIGEKNNWPRWLKNSDKVDYWDIIDPDLGEIDLHREVRNEIKNKVEKLIISLNT